MLTKNCLSSKAGGGVLKKILVHGTGDEKPEKGDQVEGRYQKHVQNVQQLHAICENA